MASAVKLRLLRELLPLLVAAAFLLVVSVVSVIGAIVGVSQRQAGCAPATFAPSRAAFADVPGNYLRLYLAAGRRYRVDWSVLAGIGSIETDHGRLRAPGVRSGENFAGAGGPMQFLAASWAAYGVDGDGNGRRDRYDPADAVPAAASYLRAAGAPGRLDAAIFAYNHAGWYVADVKQRAARYRGAARAAGGADQAAAAGGVEPAAATGCGSPGELAVGRANAREVLANRRITLTGSQRADLGGGQIDPRVIGTMAAIAGDHSFIVTSLKSDHGVYTKSGNVSNHSGGRAIDIGAVDGERCSGSRGGACGRLTISLARVGGRMRSTELIYCFDPDGPGDPRGFAADDHCDHIHVGFRAGAD